MQWNSFVKAAKKGCRGSRQSYTFGTSGFGFNRSLEGSIRSSPIEVDLLFRSKTHPDFAHTSFGYIVLDIEDVFRQIVVILGPQVSLVLHLNKLSRKA